MGIAPAEDGNDQMSAGLEWRPGTLDAVLAASPDCVYLCDRAGTILYVNVPAARHWGREREEMLGLNWQDLGLPAATLETLNRQAEMVFDTGRSLVAEVDLTTQGVTREWESLLTPCRESGAALKWW